MNLRSVAPYVCWILLVFPLLMQGQDSTTWTSEKMMAIQKAEENQRLNRLSYPEYLFESEVWQPPGNEESPEGSIPLWVYGLGLLCFTSLTVIGVKVQIRNRQRTQKQKLIWDKLASLKDQMQSGSDTELGVSIVKEVLEELPLNALQQTSIQAQLLPAENVLQLIFSVDNDQPSPELSIALSQILAAKAGSILRIQQNEKDQLHYCFSIPASIASNLTGNSSSDMLTSSSEPSIKSIDQEFLSRANELVSEKMGDANFNAEAFREEMGMSKTHFYRKLQELTQQSPGQYIRNMRLHKARQLLEAGTGNVSEVAYEVGFNNLSYFSRCFRNEFGILPSEVG